MAVDSSSTLTEVEAQYDDNASYRENGNTAECKLFIQACRILVRRYKTSAGQRGAQFSRDVRLLQDELKSAQQWYSAHAGGSQAGVTLVDLRRARR